MDTPPWSLAPPSKFQQTYPSSTREQVGAVANSVPRTPSRTLTHARQAATNADSLVSTATTAPLQPLPRHHTCTYVRVPMHDSGQLLGPWRDCLKLRQTKPAS